jgi:hypothetical protein
MGFTDSIYLAISVPFQEENHLHRRDAEDAERNVLMENRGGAPNRVGFRA